MKIYIDFDNTIVDSTKAFVDRYNMMNDTNIDSSDIVSYDFKPQIQLTNEQISEAFGTYSLYDYLKPYEYVERALMRLRCLPNVELYLISNCSDDSVIQKVLWLNKHPKINYCFTGKIFLSISKPYDKSIVDMSNSILIDDHKLNHMCSDAKYKFAFKDNQKREWYPNYDEDGVIVKSSWKDIVDEIEKIVCQNNK